MAILGYSHVLPADVIVSPVEVHINGGFDQSKLYHALSPPFLFSLCSRSDPIPYDAANGEPL